MYIYVYLGSDILKEKDCDAPYEAPCGPPCEAPCESLPIDLLLFLLI